MNPTEEQECQVFWEWFQIQHPSLVRLMFHVPNERQEAKTRKRLSKVGVQAGVSDYILLYPKGGYHGFIMEAKRSSADHNAITEKQDEFLKATARCGYYSVVAFGFNEMCAFTEQYLNFESVETPTILTPDTI